MEKTIHQGKNLKRMREMLGIKQDALAFELGEDWNQQKVSLLEGKEIIEPLLLENVAKALKIPAEAIKNFDEEKAVYNIQNNYKGSNNQGANMNYQCSFDPLEKYIQVLEENKQLYERLLKEKEAMIEELKKQDNLAQ